MRCYLRRVYGPRACDFFLICHSAELNIIVEATAPVNPCDNRMDAGCLRTEFARKGRNPGILYGHRKLIAGTIVNMYILTQ